MVGPSSPRGARTERAPSEQVTGSLERVSAGDDHEAEIAEVRDIAFPIALRGYEREAVDAYVKRVNRLIADLEATRSPDAAIRRALDRVGEETSSILQRAQETANEITERSRSSADDRIREAEREARIVTQDAEDRVRELEADYGAIWARRDRLLDEVRDLAERLLATADDAEDRFPAQGEEDTLDEADAAPDDTGSFPELPQAGGSSAATAPFGVEDAPDFDAERDETVPTTLEADAGEVPPAQLEPSPELAEAPEESAPPVGAPSDAEGDILPADEDIDFGDAPEEEGGASIAADPPTRRFS